MTNRTKTSTKCSRRISFRYSSLLLALFFSFAILPVRAQEIVGIVSGTVTDPSGAVVPGAAVKLTLDSTREAKSTITEANGTFAFLGVYPGKYTLTIAAQGFKGVQKTNINLTSSERLPLGQIALELGAPTESVTIVAQGTPVQTESSERSAVITSAQMSDLSSLSRSWTSYFPT